MIFKRKSDLLETTEFSDFIRNARSKEKKRVYSNVLKEAIKQQKSVVDKASDD